METLHDLEQGNVAGLDQEMDVVMHGRRHVFSWYNNQAQINSSCGTIISMKVPWIS
jgi:hypothetical protein